MSIPLQIIFRGLLPSATTAAKIRKNAEVLNRYAGRIKDVQVVFEQLHWHHHPGNLFHLSIALTIGGHEIVVGGELAREDADIAINDGFGAMLRRLEAMAQVPDPDRAPSIPLHGTVKHIDTGSGFALVETPVGRHVRFHRNSLEGCVFDELRPGTPVRLDAFDRDTDGGPLATKVRALVPHHPSAAAVRTGVDQGAEI